MGEAHLLGRTNDISGARNSAVDAVGDGIRATSGCEVTGGARAFPQMGGEKEAFGSISDHNGTNLKPGNVQTLKKIS